MSDRLTGRTRLRRGLFGRLILQVQVNRHREWLDPGGKLDRLDWTAWRDARVEDVPFEMPAK